MFENAGTANRALRLELLRRQDRPTAAGTHPAADPLLAASRAALDLSSGAEVYYGRVVEGVPYARTYKVQIERRNTTVACRDMAQTSLLPYGPRQVNTYSPGTGVFVLWHPQAGEGFIIGAVPDAAIDARHGSGDMVVQGSRVGLRVDLVNAYAFWMAAGGAIGDYSAGRPLDSVGGEWGYFTETGLGFFLDSFMAYVRVDEETGLFLFYDDQMTRLSGHNLQVRSSGYEREDLDDQTEFSSIEGWSAYAWEARGRRSAGGVANREFTAEQSQKVQPEYARFEPAVDDQQAFRRLVVFRGYLGQAESRFLTLPPAGSGAYRFNSNDVLPGVFEEHLALHGGYVARSLKSFTIGKTSLIAVPKAIRRPEDPSGDKPTDYKSAGLFASATGRDHAVTPLVPVEAGYPTAEEGVLRAAAIFDSLAYAYNWEALHPFHYHRLDWYLPEETALPEYASAQDMLPDFTSLAGQQYLTLPPWTEMAVDHRHGSARYYASEAFLHFADDGGIVLGDGYGFTLVTSQGSAFLTMPGDVWLMPGKNLNVWAGNDAVVRARNSIDLTTSVNDIRLAAANNVMVAAGFNNCGGVLIESRATAASYDFAGKVGEDAVLTGVVIKCRQSPVVVAGSHVLVTTNVRKYAGEMHGAAGTADPAYGEFEGGPVVIDAGRGHLVEYADVVHRHVGRSAVDVFVSGGQYRANEYWYDRAAINTPLDVNGRLAVNECIMASGDVQTAGRLVNTDGRLYVIDSTTYIDETATQMATRLAALQTYADAAKQEGRDLIEGVSDLRLAEFSFRTQAQYRTTGLVLYEARWHQMARLGNQTATMFNWTEIAASQLQKSDPDDVTYPHPGRQAWTGHGGTAAYKLQDLGLFDPLTNQKALRGAATAASPYETAEIPAPTGVIMASYYPMLYQS